MTKPDMTYASYLKLEQILSAQEVSSDKDLGNGSRVSPAHDEMLFIIIHQAYELWFKQILHEINSVLKMFDGNFVDESSIGLAVSRLTRVVEIQKLLVHQIDVLETLTPLDFLDFRGYLPGASGFQSMQFRMVENKLGLRAEQRLQYGNRPYHAEYSKADQATVQKTEHEPSLFDCVERWLERTPFLVWQQFNFLESFKGAYNKMLEQERLEISSSTSMSEQEKKLRTDMGERSSSYMRSLLDCASYEQLRAQGQVRFSFKACLGALFINLYRDQPILHMPYRLLSTLLDIEEQLNLWRHRHSIMVRRMIGMKMGTGGSSGHEYLRATVDKHAIFADLYNLSSMYIPRSALPTLSSEMQRGLGFYYSTNASLNSVSLKE